LAVQRFRDFQEGHPQYQLGTDIVDAVAAMRSGTLDEESLSKVIEMIDIMKYADSTQIHPDDIYEHRKNARLLSVMPVASGHRQSGTEPARFAKGSSDADKIIARLQAKRAQFTGAAGGGGVLRSSPKSAKQLGVETIAAASRSALGVQTDPNRGLSDSGY
jgi:hypothetical protein